MTQEEKELLLKDLCARLPYGVKIKTPGGIYTIDAISNEGLFSISNDDKTLDGLIPLGGPYWLPITGDYKPYLRPLSSMNEEELEDLLNYSGLSEHEIEICRYDGNAELEFWLTEVPCEYINKVIDWLNAHHFDYRGLIGKGLALEAPEDMYNK